MIKLLSTPFFLITLALPCMAQNQPFFAEGQDPNPTDRVWQKIDELSDEFEGSTLDTNKWSADPGAKGWGWIGRPPGLFQPENVRLQDGKMQVTVRKFDAPKVINGHEFLYGGAIVRSIHPGQVGWYYECRMKANKTEMSSTFWLMTDDTVKERQELDIQECVGRLSKEAASWARGWDQVFHSNLIKTTKGQPGKVQVQGSIETETKNWERFYVYGAWWKSPHEIRYYLDGKYAYSLKPPAPWDQPKYYQMAIETYDWNPVPEDGGLVASGTREERTTQYDWVRTWKLQ
ncbi:glycosyl hydrolase [Rhodopirellula sp. SM50]|nr:family 16 glycosylhydrolase [Rhodopirellula sp. SM50]PAY17168.1 glycosyl hydrolase [Rhodopirellula sp. SM50]